MLLLRSIEGLVAWSLVLPSGWRGRPLAERLLVRDPVVFGVVQRVDHLGHELVRLSYLQHGSSVLVAAAVVCRGEDSEEAAAGKALEAVHDALVSAQDEVDLVVLEEGLDAVGSKLHNIAGSVGVTHEVGLDTELAVAVSWVTPKNVDHELLFDRGNLMDDLERPLDLLDLLQAHQGASDTSVQADDSVLDRTATRGRHSLE